MSWSRQARGTKQKLQEQVESDDSMPTEIKDAIGDLASLASDDEDVEIDMATAGHFDEDGKGEATITIRTVQKTS